MRLRWHFGDLDHCVTTVAGARRYFRTVGHYTQFLRWSKYVWNANMLSIIDS